MDIKMFNLKLKYDTLVYHTTLGLGNVRGQITDNFNRMVKFKNTLLTIEVHLNELIIPHQINTLIYYDNEPFNITDIYIENNNLQYKISNNNEIKNIRVDDVKIHKKIKKTKEVKINQFFESIHTDLENRLTTINNTIITNNTNTIETGSQTKSKYASLLTQKYNKIVEKINKTSHQEPFKNISITQFNNYNL